MPVDTFSYVTRVVDFPGHMNRHEHYEIQAKDHHYMVQHGWQEIFRNNELTHTTTLYKRASGLNSVYFMMPSGKIVGSTLD